MYMYMYLHYTPGIAHKHICKQIGEMIYMKKNEIIKDRRSRLPLPMLVLETRW